MNLTFYQKNLTYNEELRTILTEIIILYVQYKVYAFPKIIDYISKCIINIFQFEIKVYTI